MHVWASEVKTMAENRRVWAAKKGAFNNLEGQNHRADVEGVISPRKTPRGSPAGSISTVTPTAIPSISATRLG